MNKSGFQHVYGPVYSRRLGHSLGIDLVPFKTCTYDCVYCQLGRTTNKTIVRREYVELEQVLEEAGRKLAAGPAPDYLSLAGSGEPTLHVRIGDLIAGIKRMTSIPVAVLTNGSLLWKKEVQEALMAADLVLPSLDAGDEDIFRHVNRPCEEITFERMVDGLVEFTYRFPGSVWLEIFLLGGITAIPAEVKKIADIARRIQPSRIQLNTISRPPAEEFACPVKDSQMDRLRELLPGKVEVISEKEPPDSPAFIKAETSDADILSLLSRRPCTVQGISSGLSLNPSEVAKTLTTLLGKGNVIEQRVGGRVYFSLPQQNSGNSESAQ